MFELEVIARTLNAERSLPEPFQTFMRMWSWCCATRSGVWQYYERISPAVFEETAQMMERCGLDEIAVRYRAGMKNWREPDYCGDLDAWIDDNWDAIESAAMALVESDRTCLYPINPVED